MTGVFQKWQPVYAEYGIPTFPCAETEQSKVPAIRNYGRVGLPASASLTSRFGSADMLGFMCGPRTRITALDVDSKDERVLAHALDRHGKTPIIVRTGNSKFHAWYQHSGERRRIRPWPSLPIDVLGGGFVVAPPSRVKQGQYQFIEGSLDDLDRLPLLRSLDLPATKEVRVLRGNRNNALFRMVCWAASQADDFDQLLDYARTRNSEFAEPLDDTEVVKVGISAWKYEREGRNRFGRFGSYVPLETVNQLATTNLDALGLFDVLKANNGPDSIFPIANAMANSRVAIGWRRFAKARATLIKAGLVKEVSPQTQHQPAFYCWPKSIQGHQSGE